jgi:hypothetical protein
VKSRFLQFTVADTVTCPAPLLASKNTSSQAQGLLAPQGHHDVADHFVPATVFQLSVQPTQYLSAIYIILRQ